MILSAHQSLFLPWLGFFDKIRRADVFVLVDHVQFERQDFQNRNRIKTRDGVQWLVVPVRRGSQRERIFEKEIDNKRDGRTTWGERIAGTIRHAYRRAPFFDRYMPFLEHALTRPWERLLPLNEHLLAFFLRELEIATPILASSSLPGIDGARTRMILSLCRVLDASVYFSGSGGSRDYLDVALLESEGIAVRWQVFDHPRHAQVGGDETFIPSLSVIDLLFNCGPASAAILRGEAAPSETRELEKTFPPQREERVA
ncbi:WbqC family protein [bacterium]|nr:WbqC family protein [bacterium]